MDKYDIVYSDPPWSYHGQQDKWGAAAKFYSTVSDEDMVEVASPPLNKPGILFMWTTGPKLAVSVELIKQWGLYYRGVGFIWIKTKKDGTPIGAQGVRPSIIKPLTELVLVASNIEKGRPLKLSSESVVQTIFAPKAEHSQKPHEVYDRIESLYPNASKIEMFARNRRPGWEAFGNEIDKY